MPLSQIAESPNHDFQSIDELEQHLLALGSLPCQGDEQWNAAKWARYAEVVQRLADQLTLAMPGSVVSFADQ
jgi:hypothetical protein